MKLGILSIQGDFAAHGQMLTNLGYNWTEVRQPSDLESTCGLILPGGESSTMLKLIEEQNFANKLKEYANSGKPVFGTCAGAILLASKVTNPVQNSLELLDITIERNGYGRQVDSFITNIENPFSVATQLELVFIRAPIISSVGKGVEVLVNHNNVPVLVRQKTILAATFHPELTNNTSVHKLFLEMCTRSLIAKC